MLPAAAPRLSECERSTRCQSRSVRRAESGAELPDHSGPDITELPVIRMRISGLTLSTTSSRGPCRSTRDLRGTFVAQRVHRLPEAVVKEDAQLAVLCEVVIGSLSQTVCVTLDVARRDLGGQHEKPAVDPATVAARLLAESW